MRCLRNMNVYLFNLVDYILMSKYKFGLADIKCNPDEVSDIDLVNLESLKERIRNKDIKLTPWFSLIVDYKIEDIWKSLNQLELLKQAENKIGISIML
jgi:isopentenyldiphosphate isomerase